LLSALFDDEDIVAPKCTNQYWFADFKVAQPSRLLAFFTASWKRALSHLAGLAS